MDFRRIHISHVTGVSFEVVKRWRMLVLKVYLSKVLYCSSRDLQVDLLIREITVTTKS